MWTLYHLGWLIYDLAHLGRPWAWFFIAMSALWLGSRLWARHR